MAFSSPDDIQHVLLFLMDVFSPGVQSSAALRTVQDYLVHDSTRRQLPTPHCQHKSSYHCDTTGAYQTAEYGVSIYFERYAIQHSNIAGVYFDYLQSLYLFRVSYSASHSGIYFSVGLPQRTASYN